MCLCALSSLFHGFSLHQAFVFSIPPGILKGTTIPSKVEAVNMLIEERDALLLELRGNLLKAQDQMRAQANKHRRYVDYQVGNWVFLKLQPYKLQNLAQRKNQKLSPRFYGPFKVLERVVQVAY